MILRCARARALRLFALGLVFAATVVTLPLSSLPAQANVYAAATCAISATLTFDPAVTPVPGVVGYSIAGHNSLPCVGTPLPATADFAVSGTAVASCDAVTTLFGAGDFTAGGLHAYISLAASSGGSHSQQWDFPGSDPAGFNATATLAWIGVTEMENCYLSTGTKTMTLVGSLTFAGQTLA